MNIDELVRLGADMVNAGGLANEAGRVLIERHWSQLGEDVRLALAVQGLTRLVNVEISRQRAEPVVVEAKQERPSSQFVGGRWVDARTPEQKEAWKLEYEGREREQRAKAKRRKDPAYVEEIERVHRASCFFHWGDSKQGFCCRERCVMELTGGRDPREVPE